MSQNVILLEFNELSPTLMNRFINQGHLPNFKRFSEESAVYLTEAAERSPYLDPWIQWVTVHTGLDFTRARHRAAERGAHRRREAGLGLTSTERGQPVWICGSMNVGIPARHHAAPSCPIPGRRMCAPTPAELKPYFSFIQRNVLEYTNERVPLTRVGLRQFRQVHGAARAVAEHDGCRSRSSC